MENDALKQIHSNLKSVVLLGPESTGKTTLSLQLATHYKTQCVPEYARQYLQHKWDNEQKICEYQDLLPIAKGQMALENNLAKKTNTVLICDTNLLQTKLYSEVYFNGSCPPLIKKYAHKNTYNFYFLSYIDVPWEPDDLRDKPNERKLMFDYFKSALDRYKLPYRILKGTQKERFQLAKQWVDKLLKPL